jgi:predicted peroxiredoxin
VAKFVIVSTAYKENPERASLPWAVASTAVAEGHDTMVFLQGPAVQLAQPGGAEGIAFDPFPPVADLIQGFVEAGGQINVCGPCMQAHNVDAGNLIEGAEAAGAAFLVEQAAEAQVFSY